MMGPTMGCFVEGCVGDTWPDEDWLIFDTPVGAFEILLCEPHYEAYERGALPFHQPASWVQAVELVLEHPVTHGG